MSPSDSPDAATAREPQERSLPGGQKWLALAGIGCGVFMSTLDSGIVNIALPTLVADLGASFAAVQWVVISYLLIMTSLMLGVARLGDMLGKKGIYLRGVALFTVASLACGLAPSIQGLIGFRALQGIGAVMMTALGTAIVTEVFPASERGRALGIIGGVVSVGIAAGPSLGGVLIGLAGWRVAFIAKVPVGIVTYLVVRRVVPTSAPGRPGQRFDLAGAAILFVTLACYALGMTMGQQAGFGDRLVQGLLIIAAAGMAAFLRLESGLDQPMIDLRLFRNPLFGINLLMGFLVFVVTSGMFLMPFFLQNVKGYSTELMGLLTAVVPVITASIAPLSGGLSDRYGSRGISLLGLLVVVMACLSISTLHAGVTPLGYVLRLAPLGFGLGLFQSPNNSAIMGAAPRERLGLASGLLSLSRTLGQTSGMPLMGMMFAAQVRAQGHLTAGAEVMSAPSLDLVAGLDGAFRIAALGIALAASLAALAWRLDRDMARPARAAVR